MTNKLLLNAKTGIEALFKPKAITLLLPVVMIAGCGEAQIESSRQAPAEDQLSRIEFSTPQDGIWPPLARSVENFQSIDRPSSPVSQNDNLSTAISTDTQATAALGDNYSRFFTTIDRVQKSSPQRETRKEFYNYDVDQTIQISRQGSNPLQVSERAAIDYQPPENHVERATAIELARIALRASGFTDHEQLTGTAMLAYPNEQEVAATGSQFYRERLLYVTFGPGNGQLPVFSALVNLSRETVVQSGLVH